MQEIKDDVIEILEEIQKSVPVNHIYEHINQALAKLKDEPEPSAFTKEMREKYKYAIKNKLTIHISAYVKALNAIDRLGDENETKDKRIAFLESCIKNDARKNHFRKMADGLCETGRVQRKLLDKLADKNKRLQAENKKLVEGQQARKIADS